MEDVIHPEADAIIQQVVLFIILILCTYYMSEFLQKEFLLLILTTVMLHDIVEIAKDPSNERKFIVYLIRIYGMSWTSKEAAVGQINQETNI